MVSAVERLTSYVGAQDRFDIPYDELLPLQIEAANERFQDRIGKIRLLRQRAEAENVTAIKGVEDIVPLLFAHTAYKSYPDSWFNEGKWDRMGLWLDTVTSYRVKGVDSSSVADVDDWIERLAAAGCFVSCSSGTTGKCSMLPATAEDRSFSRVSYLANFQWSTGMPALKDYIYVMVSPIAQSFRAEDIQDTIKDAFASSAQPFPGERITVGTISRMAALRRAIAEGTARPSDIAAYKEIVPKREKEMEDALQTIAERFVANRDKKHIFLGIYPSMFKIAEIVRSMGYGPKDFSTENALAMHGGLKGANLPGDYQEVVLDTFNIRPERSFGLYGMQEVNTMAPQCRAGRYHVSPWMIPVILDQPGEKLIPRTGGEIEGRSAWFDLSMDGRWGGVITGDKIRIDYGKCACGHQGPTLAEEVVRYADLPGGDKITCSASIDAYVRGVA
jgi:hypothetical protein